jgi:hypothetical protein
MVRHGMKRGSVSRCLLYMAASKEVGGRGSSETSSELAGGRGRRGFLGQKLAKEHGLARGLLLKALEQALSMGKSSKSSRF